MAKKKLKNSNTTTISQKAHLALPRSFQVIEVPADGNCLFWAAALAYLLSLTNDQFEEGFKRLFGEDYLVYSQIIKVLTKVLIEDFSSAITSFHEHPLLSILISQIFRKRVVAYMESHREAFDPSITEGFASYLEVMAAPGVWGGDPEVKAISGLLNCTIFVVPSWYNGNRLKFGEGEPTLYLLHQTNHYWFALNRRRSFFIEEFHVMAKQLDFSASETESENEEITDCNGEIFHQEFQ